MKFEETYDYEIEKSILSTAFVNQESIKKLCKIQSYYFFDDKNRKILEAMIELNDQNKLIDILTLTEYMGIDWAMKIVDIGNIAITDVFLDQHIEILKKKAWTRKMSLLNDPEELKEFIDAYEKENGKEESSIIPPEEIKRLTLEYYDKGGENTLSTGWRLLDQYYKISKEQVSVVTGIPASGKSAWIDALCVNLATEYDWKFMFYSPENYPTSRHIRKLIENHSGLPFFNDFKYPRLSKGDLEIELNWIREHFIFIRPTPENRELDAILNQILWKKVDGVIIDPWNELESLRSSGMSETEYISNCLSKIKSASIQNEIHIWIVAHPTKLVKNDDGSYPAPTPYDISGSANWRNKADNCIAVHRPDLTKHRVEIHIQKIRFKDNGAPGKIELNYDYNTQRFSEVL